jgi:hypothetical protein
MKSLRQLSPFNNEAMRHALVARLNEVPGLAISENVTDKWWAFFKLQALKREDALEKLMETLKWVIGAIGQRQQVTRS